MGWLMCRCVTSYEKGFTLRSALCTMSTDCLPIYIYEYNTTTTTNDK